MTRPATIAVIGEALIDLAGGEADGPWLARPGGSPFNVAIGLARLDRDVAFVGRLSHDPLGTVLRTHAQRSELDLRLCVDAPEPSTTALVELDADGSASYTFGVDGTADFGWTSAELARIPDEVNAVHFGSLASWLPPGDRAIAERVRALRASGAVITYDPNVRPHLQPDRAAACAAVEAAVALAHLVKTSAEDIAYLYPGEAAAAVAARWRSLGPGAVIVTEGGAGATAFAADGDVSRRPPPITVVDTVGAGDAFMSGLLDSLDRAGLLTPGGIGGVDYAQLLDDAGLLAAITCSRPGANPPRRQELASFRA